jgi:hypothetical protein
MADGPYSDPLQSSLILKNINTLIYLTTSSQVHKLRNIEWEDESVNMNLEGCEGKRSWLVLR